MRILLRVQKFHNQRLLYGSSRCNVSDRANFDQVIGERGSKVDRSPAPGSRARYRLADLLTRVVVG